MVEVNVGWLFIFLAVISNSVASIVLKSAVVAGISIRSTQAVLSTFPQFGFAAIFYVMAFFMYALALGRLPLHIAHPMSTAIPILIVFSSSIWLFGERPSVVALVGVALVVAGLMAIGVSSR